MVATQEFVGELPLPIETLERHFNAGGIGLVRAVFENTFFVAPSKVRERCPYFPGHARKSRTHYPGLDNGAQAEWNGQAVRLDFNARAQMAWERYTGRPIERQTGYGVRHVWGHPWDPKAYTAGWNLAYMPFWAGMLTEDQHPHHLVRAAIKQAGWDLFFASDPVCEPPGYVSDPGLDLDDVLAGQPLLIATAPSRPERAFVSSAVQLGEAGSPAEQVVALRRLNGNSWSNLRKAARSLAAQPHEPFSTRNVENKSKSDVRKMLRETALELDELVVLLDSLAPDSPAGDL